MNWQELCDDRHLQDLPFKIELNGMGQVVMSPASNEHGRLQTLIAAKLLLLAAPGEVITETSIDTTDGTRVADVSWGSAAFYEEHGVVTPLPAAPEICVEILSLVTRGRECRLQSSCTWSGGAPKSGFATGKAH